MAEQPLKVVVLISGSGTNLQSIIDQQKSSEPGIEIVAVISNKENAGGLARAAKHGIPSAVLNHKQYPSREAFDQALLQLIDSYSPGLVVLAGFMRILTPDFTKHYLGRMMNIHPSLLPKYQGLNTHQRALDSGDEIHGATVHFVTAELDGGPPILQATVPIEPGDTAESLAARVLIEEHRIYPEAIHWFAKGRVKMREGKSWLDGKMIQPA